MTEFNAQQARAKRPCPLWVDAFQRDTQHLQADEVGAYMLILMAMWTRETCDFPDDDNRLARVSRVSTRLWKSRVGPIIKEFFICENGVVTSKRLREEATYVERHVTQQSSRKKGEKSRKALKTNKPGKTTDEPQNDPPYQPTQQPNNPTEKKEDKSSSSSGEADCYLRYLKAHPNPVESADGESAFDSLVADGIDPEQIIASARAYAERAKTFSDKRFVQQSDNFLSATHGKWTENIPRTVAPPADPKAKLEAWASNVREGRGFGLERQMAEQLVAAKMVTTEQLAAAQGYNG